MESRETAEQGGKGSKLTPALIARVANVPRGEAVDVVLELTARVVDPPGELVGVDPGAPLRQAFERDAHAAEEAVRSAGGTVLGKAWINQTMRASVPVEALARLARLEAVVAIDVPRTLRAE